MDEEKKECSCKCPEGQICGRNVIATNPNHALRYTPDYLHSTSLNSIDPSCLTTSRHSNGLTYDADYHPIKKAMISDIVVKEVDFGYIVKVGCQTLAISTKEDLIKMFTEYVNDPSTVTRRWNNGHYHGKIEAEPRTKYIGVIVQSIADFSNWEMETLKGSEGKRRNGSRMITINIARDDKYDYYKYIGMSQQEHTIGYSLDELIETPKAKENKNYEQLVLSAKICMREKDGNT